MGFGFSDLWFAGLVLIARVARLVMSEAAKHLTPVTLELGGKCPAIVDFVSSSWTGKAVVKRILGGKFGACGGQACIAVDYILIEKKHVSTLVELLKKTISRRQWCNVYVEYVDYNNSLWQTLVDREHQLRQQTLQMEQMDAEIARQRQA